MNIEFDIISKLKSKFDFDRVFLILLTVFVTTLILSFYFDNVTFKIVSGVSILIVFAIKIYMELTDNDKYEMSGKLIFEESQISISDKVFNLNELDRIAVGIEGAKGQLFHFHTNVTNMVDGAYNFLILWTEKGKVKVQFSVDSENKIDKLYDLYVEWKQQGIDISFSRKQDYL